MTVTNPILERLNDPRSLELLYRHDAETFQEALAEALTARPDSDVLAVWRARVDFVPDGRQRNPWLTTLLFASAAALLVRGPVALGVDAQWYYPRLAPFLIILSVAAYFLCIAPDSKRVLMGLALTAITVTYVLLLGDYSDSVIMALVHLPIVAWSYVAIVYAGERWRETGARLRFIRFTGELVVLIALIALGGMVLTGLTMALFAFIDADIAEWYMGNVVILGVAGAPVVATYLYDVVFDRRTRIAEVLARVFAPLVLVTVLAYVCAMFLEGRTPFGDREFLITFNGLLLLVLGISIFSVARRVTEPEVGLSDYVNLALLGVTLLIDAIALSAIAFRLATYGLTPNRVTVLGTNLVVIVHLSWIFVTYLRVLRGRAGFDAMTSAVARYLPVYTAWAAFVAFVLPVPFALG